MQQHPIKPSPPNRTANQFTDETIQNNKTDIIQNNNPAAVSNNTGLLKKKAGSEGEIIPEMHSHTSQNKVEHRREKSRND